MKVSLNWIKDYVKLPEDMDLTRLAYDLTMSTVEAVSYTHLDVYKRQALHRAVHLRHQIGVAAHDVPHPSAKLLLRGGGVFEADGGMLNIVAVNFQQTGRIGDTGVPDNDRHGVFLPDNGIDCI